MQDILMALIFFGGLSMIFMTIFGYFAFMRYLRHKETMALAEKGLLKPENVVEYNGTKYNGNSGYNKKLLNRAIILTAVGFALCLGLYPIGFVAGDDFPLYIGPWMIAGFLPLFFGIALIIIYTIPLLPNLLNQLDSRGVFSRMQTDSSANEPNVTDDSLVEAPLAENSLPESNVMEVAQAPARESLPSQQESSLQE